VSDLSTDLTCEAGVRGNSCQETVSLAGPAHASHVRGAGNALSHHEGHAWAWRGLYRKTMLGLIIAYGPFNNLVGVGK